MRKILIVLLLCVVIVFDSCDDIPRGSNVSDVFESEISKSGSLESETEGSETDVSKTEISETDSANSEIEASKEDSGTEISNHELNGTLEKIDLDCEIEIIKMPFIADNPGIAGNFQFGNLLSTPDDIVLDDVMKSAYDTKDYDEWVKKYTDEWFKENWLIKFIVYQPSFDYEETGVYLSNSENSESMLYFYLGEEKVRENVKPNDPHYYVFIEIPKENIKYDLTECYFMTLTDLTYDSEIK